MEVDLQKSKAVNAPSSGVKSKNKKDPWNKWRLSRLGVAAVLALVAMLLGVHLGANAADLDFDSVQRGNPEIQRRAQEVVNHCWSLGADNPILAIHDVGAGGISNAFPELVDGAGLGPWAPSRADRPSAIRGSRLAERPRDRGSSALREPEAGRGF